MSDIKTLIKKRSSLKSKLTIYSNYLTLISSSAQISELQRLDLQERFHKFETLHAEFDDLQTDIEMLIDDAETALTDRENFDRQFFSLVALTRSLLGSSVNVAGSEAGFKDADSDPLLLISTMMTRKATAKDTENKLKLALLELKKCKDENSLLLRERVDCEEEIKEVNHKVVSLKGELAELHIENMDLLDQRDRLQQEVSSFGSCNETYEWSLSRINELETSLHEAHTKIISLERSIQSFDSSATHHLYSELIGCKSLLTRVRSNKKFRKFTRISKIIKKLELKLKKFNKLRLLVKSNKDLIEERRELVLEVNSCSEELISSRLLYDRHTLDLKSQISHLQTKLTKITLDYERETHDYILKYDEIAKVGRENLERVRALADSDPCTRCSQSQGPPCDLEQLEPSQTSLGTETSLTDSSDSIPSSFIDLNTKNRVAMFSDKLGINLGPLINNNLHCSFKNNCYHNLKLNQIVDRIRNTRLDINTTVVLLIGDSLGLDKTDIIDSISSLLQLDLGKLIICAFPYSQSLTERENKRIHRLNNQLHLMTSYHSDKLLFFDTNKFISSFIYTQETMFLNSSDKRRIATLLAYNINTVIGAITQFRLRDDPVLCSYSNNTVIKCIGSVVSDKVTNNVSDSLN
ncbi:uncharacterized protein LOC142985814 [Anticarsia gemmatalis]|uniref:uncharacterized protein LOC142985814 n=1 Tax=Anticarsia gemmatalis TaxID=129554 RepID=UPI003F762D7C